MDSRNIVLCGSSAYEKKFYINEEFSLLPESIKKELNILCVIYTEEVGGVLTLEFDDSGSLIFHVSAKEEDLLFDEIGSGLKIKEIQKNRKDFLESLEAFYKVFYLGEDLEV